MLYNSTFAQISFLDFLPAKPYCSYDKQIRFILPREKAIEQKYIQLSHPLCARGFAVDIDNETEEPAFPWELAELPVPSFAVWNKENGHSHLIWLFEHPIFAKSGEGKRLRELAENYRDALGGDKAIVFQKQLIKNPLNSHWKTLSTGKTYSLCGLAESVQNCGARKGKSREELLNIAGKGRNCGLFGTVRKEAYSLVRGCKSEGELLEKITAITRLFNAGMPRGFAGNESDMKSIPKSIAKWTWEHRGSLGAQRRKARTEQQDEAESPQGARGQFMRREGWLARERLVIAFRELQGAGKKVTAAGLARGGKVSRKTAQKYIGTIDLLYGKKCNP